MRLAYFNEEGELELRWTWLPTFMGQNYDLLRKLQDAWSEKFLGRETSDDVLEEVHQFTIKWLSKKIHIAGVEEYLSGIRSVEE